MYTHTTYIYIYVCINLLFTIMPIWWFPVVEIGKREKPRKANSGCGQKLKDALKMESPEGWLAPFFGLLLPFEFAPFSSCFLPFFYIIRFFSLSFLSHFLILFFFPSHAESIVPSLKKLLTCSFLFPYSYDRRSVAEIG